MFQTLDAGHIWTHAAGAHASGDFPRAQALCDELLRMQPQHAKALHLLGLIAAEFGDLERARTLLEASVAAGPDFARTHFDLAKVRTSQGDADGALSAYETAVALDPGFAEAHNNLGSCYLQVERRDDALRAYTAAIRARPDLAQISCNLATVLIDLGRADEARAALESARRLGMNVPAIQLSLNRSFRRLGCIPDAINAAQRAIELQPANAEAHANLALARLIGGDFSRGWDDYAWVWRVPARRAQYPYLDRAELWNGESFAGRELRVTPDQGFGDAIQMVRYLPAVKARGGRVVLEAPPALLPLFADLPGVDELRPETQSGAVDASVDLHVPLMGLPRAFNTRLDTIPATVPYLRAQPERIERWRPRMQHAARLRVGIVWAGNPGHENDRNRSVQPDDFSALAGIPGIAWFSLQKGRDEDRRACGALEVQPLGPSIVDFADTAAIVAGLDLIIAVDTAIVHLAGALGTPVFTLLPFAPDWRWMLGRTDSPWYPTMRLFRQPRIGDWNAVFADVARRLREYPMTNALP